MTPPMTPREKVAPSLSDLLRQAVETMKSWTPEQREAHFEAQKKAWVAAEMAFGDEGTRAVTALASGSGDQAELASLAEAATPGPWETHPEAFSPRTFVIPTHHASDDPAVGSILSRQDAAFIAAANPATVLALLAEIAALRGENEHVKKLRHQAIDRSRLWEIDAIKWETRATEAERKLAEAREIIQHLEWSCEQLAATRSQAAYDQMMSDGQAQALWELDNARRAARTFLSKEAERG